MELMTKNETLSMRRTAYLLPLFYSATTSMKGRML